MLKACSLFFDLISYWCTTLMGGFHFMILARTTAFKSYNIFLHREVGSVSLGDKLGPRYFFKHRESNNSDACGNHRFKLHFFKKSSFLKSSGIIFQWLWHRLPTRGSPACTDTYNLSTNCLAFWMWLVFTIPLYEILLSVLINKNCAPSKKS